MNRYLEDPRAAFASFDLAMDPQVTAHSVLFNRTNAGPVLDLTRDICRDAPNRPE